MTPDWLTALAATLGPATGALTGLLAARRAIRTARTSADHQALAELHAGYQALLKDRATHTRDVLAELTAVKTELSAVRQENARLLLEVGALRAQMNRPPEGPPTP
ncbi:hypothetical protein NQK81_09165 [Amycolatopsis roodepoortensis]|uniref:hypothetical protein n=1 Tax=Amycolatopsis TaxID=1813 RepID=UPI00214CCF76|nr:hypothetical protein [Amycolatopsis roodepoortensis]UUV33606.1 hypothetical protein NQK81_09165 [Amycolatopsis roodepoortensis]